MDPVDLRADIPALDEVVYMNTGASGPAPERVLAAGRDALDWHEGPATVDPGPYRAAWDAEDDTRAVVADLLGATPDEIALTSSTADGISRVANAVDWDPGDVVVRTDLEHSAGTLPWDRLRSEGVEVRTLACPDGRLDPDALADAAADAKLVCLSSISWLHGTRLPVRAAVEVAHDAGALVLVDAVQSVGQVPVDVHEWGADAVAAAGHKWLLGVWGAGFLYVRGDRLDRFEPRHVSYRGVDDRTWDGGLDYHPSAARFEIGTMSPVPYAALREAISLHHDLGADVVRAHDLDLARRLVDGLDDDRLASPREPESGLVTFEVADAAATVEHLRNEDIVVRSVPAEDRELVRASLHVFNTPEDVDALLAEL